MTGSDPHGELGYEAATAEYDPELDDPEDDATGYENDADAEGDFAQEIEPSVEPPEGADG